MAISDTAIDEGRLQEFVGRFAGDLGAALHQTTVLIGDKLGLYAAMSDGEPVTPGVLAARTGTDERYVREWLCAQAASGYVEYDAESERFFLTPGAGRLPRRPAKARRFFPARSTSRRRACATSRRSPSASAPARVSGWHEHDGDLFCGTELFFRPGYVANLVPSLAARARRCRGEAAGRRARRRHRLRTRRVDDRDGQGLPATRSFVGFDYHAESVAAARRAAERAGVGDRVRFEVASAKDFPGEGYDLVCVFDALHDMGDPVGAAAHVLARWRRDGSWLIVEPMAGDRTEENLNPVGRIFYSASTMICTPASRAQEVGLALGAQAGEARLRAVVTDAGFTRFRRATETPFNLVLEARP